MPVRKVGKASFKWGNSGKTYSGPGAKEKAEAQAKAAYANGYREGNTMGSLAKKIIKKKGGRA